MNKKLKKNLPYLSVAIAVTLIIMASPYTIWEQCQTCGVQKFERGIFKVKVESWSLEELDEYGTYAEWKKLHQKERCEHQFTEVKHKTPAMKLEQLNQETH